MLKLKAKRVGMGVRVDSKGHFDVAEAVSILLQAVKILKETFNLDTKEIIDIIKEEEKKWKIKKNYMQ
nr:hypothetical protein [Clostridia bacterium]